MKVGTSPFFIKYIAAWTAFCGIFGERRNSSRSAQ